jgi:preprotein translocase subunit SecF
MEFIKPGTQFDFMGKRWYFIGLSAFLLLLSIVTFFKPGPKLGTDFKGGTEVVVAFLKPVDAGAIREAAVKSGFEAPDVVKVEDAKQPHAFMIRVQEVSALSEVDKAAIRERMCLPADGRPAPEDKCPAGVRAVEVKFSPGGDKITARYEAEPDKDGIRKQLTGLEGLQLRPGENIVAGKARDTSASERDHKVEIFLKSKGDQLMDGLRTQLGADAVPADPLRVEWVGPKAGAQLRDAAIKSVLIAIFFIMAYIAIRFDVRFAPGGILALVHDVGIALGAMIITQREITLSTVAAMLTIVGYSITDTVIVYDRIRENLAKHRDMTFSQIINMSISEMFGRTIISSGVTSLSMVMFLIWGTGALKDFAFTLLIGFLVGTYSSIYVAAPFTEWIDRRFFGSKAGERKKLTRTRAAKKADAVV